MARLEDFATNREFIAQNKNFRSALEGDQTALLRSFMALNNLGSIEDPDSLINILAGRTGSAALQSTRGLGFTRDLSTLRAQAIKTLGLDNPTTVEAFLSASPKPKPAPASGITAFSPERQAQQEAIQAAKAAGTYGKAPVTATPVAPSAPSVAPSTPAITGFGPSSYTGVSIVDYLKSVNQPSDFTSRAKLAAQFGITGYSGTAAQNTQLLQTLRSGGGAAPSAPTFGAKPGQVYTDPVTGRTFVRDPNTGILSAAGEVKGGVSPFTGQPVSGGPAGGAPGGGVPEAPVDPNKAARDAAAAEANAAANAIFDNLGKSDVSTRESSKILADIEEKIEEEAPEAPSLADLFNKERARLGIDTLETRLSDLDSEIDRINTTLLVEAERAGERLVSMAEITRRRGTLQKEAEQRIALLSVERSAVARMYENKLNTLNTYVNLTNQDFQNASKQYDDDFNRLVTLQKLVAGEEEVERTAVQEAKDDARTNLTALQNIFVSGGLDYNVLTADQKLQVQKLEIQAGLPGGITSKIMSENPGGKIQATTSRTDPSGNVYYDVLLAQPDGSLTVRSIFRGKEPVSSKKTIPETDKIDTATKNAILGRADAELRNSLGTDRKADPDVYMALRSEWGSLGLSVFEFDEKFAHLLSDYERNRLGVKEK